jgi:hypothetical protein
MLGLDLCSFGGVDRFASAKLAGRAQGLARELARPRGARVVVPDSVRQSQGGGK